MKIQRVIFSPFSRQACSICIRVWLCLLASLLLSSQVQAKQSIEKLHRQELAALYQQLSVERQRIQVSQTKLDDLQQIRKKQISETKSQQVTQQILERARLNLAVAQADNLAIKQSLEEAEHKISRTKETIRQTNERLQDARVSAVNGEKRSAQIAAIQLLLDFQQSLYDLRSARLKELQRALAIAEDIVAIETQWVERLTHLFQQRQNALREEVLEKLVEQSQQERQQWLNQLEGYNQKLQAYTAEQRFIEPQAILLAVEIFYTEESIALSRVRLDVALMQDAVEDLSFSPEQVFPIPEIDKRLNRSTQLLTTFAQLAKQLEAKVTLLNNQIEISKKTHQQGIIGKEQLGSQLSLLSPLLDSYQQLKTQLSLLKQRVKEQQERIQTALTEAIARRQGLPGLDLSSWISLVDSLSHMPTAAVSVLTSLTDQLGVALKAMYWPWWVILVVLELIWLIVMGLCRRYILLGIDAVAANRQRLSANVAFVVLQLFKRSLTSLTLFGVAILLFFYSGIPYQSYRLVIFVFLLWFAFRFIIGIARITLLETMSNVSGHDVHLYHRLKWVFGLGGLITVLTMLSHQLHVAYEVRDVFNRLFMLFLLALSLVLLKGRHVVPSLFDTHTEHGRPYLRRAVSLMSTLIPLALLSNAVVGLSGYVQLAWVMSYYQIVFLLMLTAYVIFRGLLIDLLDVAATLSIRYLQNGWLWSQALLKPLDRILRIAVAIGAITGLFLSYGWGPESAVVVKLYNIVHYPLYKFGTGSAITILSLIEFVILVAVVFWAARWTREFTYRWLFGNMRDQGLRNSLSIFCQYATVAIGSLITLRVLGIDVSGLSYIFGGLAVGLGFGLRDVANNLVSGVMLLIERPVREGDLVSVGEFEGRVTHIGIRAMMVKSWDHMEVLIPNAEAFNKAFTNWTHQDSIVRTVISIKIQRQDDPTLVQQLIYTVLEETPGVLKEPEPQVLLRELDDALIEFQVRYFLNLQEHSRVVMRSEVLFALWESFKAHHIHPPYSQQGIRLLDGPQGDDKKR